MFNIPNHTEEGEEEVHLTSFHSAYINHPAITHGGRFAPGREASVTISVLESIANK